MVDVTKLNLAQDSEASFGQNFKFKDADVWLSVHNGILVKILKLGLVKILKLKFRRDFEAEVSILLADVL